MAPRTIWYGLVRSGRLDRPEVSPPASAALEAWPWLRRGGNHELAQKEMRQGAPGGATRTRGRVTGDIGPWPDGVRPVILTSGRVVGSWTPRRVRCARE